jgi:hypothetical protein
MKQIIHILQKDVRHFWLEILISIVLLAVFVWMEPKLWHDYYLVGGVSFNRRGFFGPDLVESLLLFLIPVSWWLFIARVVHEERLVGDRQFWITRPYEWQNLLGAKTLIITGSIYVPLAAAQCWLLAVAGLHPASHIGALLYDWLLLAALPILPLAALAAVTRSFARMTLTLLGVLVAGAGLAVILISLSQKGMFRSQVDYNDPLSIPVILLICGAVIVIAYWSRRIVVGRIMLLALPVLLVLILELLSSDAMVNRNYPEIGDAGIRFSLKDNGFALESAHPAINSSQLYIQIPLSVNGIAPGDLWIGKGDRVTIESGGQTLWMSSWRELSFYLSANGNATLGFNVDRTVFERIQSQPVTLHLEIALDQAHRAQIEASQISFQDIAIPWIGVCSSIIDPLHRETVGGIQSPAIVGLTCRSALRDPQLTYVETSFTPGPCQSTAGNRQWAPGVQGTWIGNLNDDPAGLVINPVEKVPLNVEGSLTSMNADNSVHFKRFCPGAPITFTRYAPLRQLRTEFTIDNFQFPSYDKREDAAH